jgi:NAD(P)-dependent dehydrogenase (short-subunit alcohol dehydrogenase family)
MAEQPLRERVVLVTGASRRAGIGAAVARRVAVAGADVFLHSWTVHDRAMPWGADEAGAEALLEELRALGRRTAHEPADFADPTAPERVVDAAVAAFGHIDVLVANHARSSHQALEQLTGEELDLSYAVNTRATLLLVKAFAAQHDGRDGGRVVLLTSGQYAGPMPDEPEPQGALRHLRGREAVKTHRPLGLAVAHAATQAPHGLLALARPARPRLAARTIRCFFLQAELRRSRFQVTACLRSISDSNR